MLVPDTNISQGSAVTHLRSSGMLNDEEKLFYYKFTTSTESADE